MTAVATHALQMLFGPSLARQSSLFHKKKMEYLEGSTKNSTFATQIEQQ